MDIRVKSVLDFIQSQKGYENAVIAGGAVRDYHYDLEPRDYDVFIPIDSRQSVADIIGKISKEFNLDGGPKDKGKQYADAKRLVAVKEITFEGKVFDIIGKYAKNDDQFGFEVIKDFDYGNSMAFYNGLYVEDNNEHWRYDVNNGTMSLVNIRSLNDLPKAMDRFNRFNQKLRETRKYDVRFRTTALSIIKQLPPTEKGKIKGELVWDPAADMRNVRPRGEPLDARMPAPRPVLQDAMPRQPAPRLDPAWDAGVEELRFPDPIRPVDLQPRDERGRFRGAQARRAGDGLGALGAVGMAQAIAQDPNVDLRGLVRRELDRIEANRFNPVGEIPLPVRNNRIPMIEAMVNPLPGDDEVLF